MKLYKDRNGICIVLLKLTGLEISMFVKKISIFDFPTTRWSGDQRDRSRLLRRLSNLFEIHVDESSYGFLNAASNWSKVISFCT